MEPFDHLPAGGSRHGYPALPKGRNGSPLMIQRTGGSATARKSTDALGYIIASLVLLGAGNCTMTSIPGP